MLKRLCCLILTVAACCSLSACSLLDLETDNLLSPPRLEGELYHIQEALIDFAGDEITLKYPTAGDYRSAFILRDINGDGKEEAIAFYSRTEDSTVMMHINILTKEDEWKSKGDISLVGSGVEKVVFSDLAGDGIEEISVGWSIYGTVERQVGIYSFDGKVFTQRAMENYTEFFTVDIDDDKKEELFVINLNSTEKIATAKAISINQSGVEEKGVANLDGSVSSYYSPVVSSLSDGRPAVYIDAVKGSGSLTEIVWFEDGGLKSIYDGKAAATTLTYRSNIVASRDFTGDGIIDIPLQSLLLSTADKEDFDKVYVTDWSSFNGEKITKSESAFMNYSDGYYITIPKSRQDRLHLARKTDSRLRIFYSYDPETHTQGNEVFRVLVLSKVDYEAGRGEGYSLIGEKGNLYFLARVAEENEIAFTKEELIQNFGIIE